MCRWATVRRTQRLAAHLQRLHPHRTLLISFTVYHYVSTASIKLFAAAVTTAAYSTGAESKTVSDVRSTEMAFGSGGGARVVCTGGSPLVAAAINEQSSRNTIARDQQWMTYCARKLTWKKSRPRRCDENWLTAGRRTKRGVWAKWIRTDSPRCVAWGGGKTERRRRGERNKMDRPLDFIHRY